MNYRTSVKPTAAITAIYALWAINAPTPVGDGGNIILLPFVAVAVYAAHNFLRWMIK